MYYRFYAEETYFDVRYRVNWEEKHRVLKLETDVSDSIHTAAVPAGKVTRGENPADVPLGAWVRADDIIFAANGMFAYRMKDKKLGLTVLRSPIYGDLRLGELDEEIDYDIIDRGITEGGIRADLTGIFEAECAGASEAVCAERHTADSGAFPWNMAEHFNNLPVVIAESNHDGQLPCTDCFFTLQDHDGLQVDSILQEDWTSQSDHVMLAALKKCEDDDSVIVRLVETGGKTGSVKMTVLGKACETDIAPYEIKTLKLDGRNATKVNMLEE